VGDGELREDLKEHTRSLGVDDVVRFLGWRRDMGEVYRGLDLLLLTSDNEGTPVTVIEAMAAGVPVISTAVGGVPDIFGIEVGEDGCRREGSAQGGAKQEGGERTRSTKRGDEEDGGRRDGGVASVHIAPRGILIPPNDPEALARALEILVNDQELRQRLSAAAREYVLEIYDKKRLVKDVSSLYDDAFRKYL
jgi:glycosyltransferase involved in cell wall biosynthesis